MLSPVPNASKKGGLLRLAKSTCVCICAEDRRPPGTRAQCLHTVLPHSDRLHGATAESASVVFPPFASTPSERPVLLLGVRSGNMHMTFSTPTGRYPASPYNQADMIGHAHAFHPFIQKQKLRPGCMYMLLGVGPGGLGPGAGSPNLALADRRAARACTCASAPSWKGDVPQRQPDRHACVAHGSPRSGAGEMWHQEGGC